MRICFVVTKRPSVRSSTLKHTLLKQKSDDKAENGMEKELVNDCNYLFDKFIKTNNFNLNFEVFIEKTIKQGAAFKFATS